MVEVAVIDILGQVVNRVTASFQGLNHSTLRMQQIFLPFKIYRQLVHDVFIEWRTESTFT